MYEESVGIDKWLNIVEIELCNSCCDPICEIKKSMFGSGY